MKITLTQVSALIIGFIFIGKIYAALFYGADLALFPEIYNTVFCPAHCWSFPTSIPYSVIWVLMNPLWLGRFWYGVYIVIFDAITVILWSQVKRVPKLYLACLQILSIMFYLGQGAEYQNISIIVFYPLMFFALKDGKVSWKRLALLAAIPILIKMPLGWSWDFSDIHAQCATSCLGIVTQHLSIADRIMNGISNYGILVGSWLLTVRVVTRISKHRKV